MPDRRGSWWSCSAFSICASWCALVGRATARRAAALEAAWLGIAEGSVSCLRALAGLAGLAFLGAATGLALRAAFLGAFRGFLGAAFLARGLVVLAIGRDWRPRHESLRPGRRAPGVRRRAKLNLDLPDVNRS